MQEEWDKEERDGEEQNLGFGKKQASILKSLSKTELDVKIVMVEQDYSIGELIGLSPGSVLNFKSGIDTASWLAINGKKFAYGQVVQVGEKFGFQVSQLNEEGTA